MRIAEGNWTSIKLCCTTKALANIFWKDSGSRVESAVIPVEKIFGSEPKLLEQLLKEANVSLLLHRKEPRNCQI
jgi:hypothetical protein